MPNGCAILGHMNTVFDKLLYIVLIISSLFGVVVYSARMEHATRELDVIKYGVDALGSLILLLGMMILKELMEMNKK